EGLTIAVCSCYYDYYHVDQRYRTALTQKNLFPASAFKLLIGDNLYSDVAPGQAWVVGGFSETVARYSLYWWNSDYTEVLQTLPTFTCWDDHEFWNNYPEHQPHLA